MALEAESLSKIDAAVLPQGQGRLIVIGFLGGNVSADNLAHREAQLIQSLQQNFPASMHAMAFANRDANRAFATVLQLLDHDRDGQLNDAERHAARVVIYGHSWGASETVDLARRLNKLNVPVLLTIQVDSVKKRGQNDRQIPPNVREAVNFYQTEGLLRGRERIVAMDSIADDHPRQLRVELSQQFCFL